MAQRTVALYEDQYIGIETIYTIIDGKQINIPEKIKALRKLSQDNKLFCPCGCGKNLILVAGDKNLREQHFREKTGTGTYSCDVHEESDTSINSKIVLKCWLDDKLHDKDLKSRVPISSLEDSKRKPEFTFLSEKENLAVRYWRSRQNIMEDKLDIISGCRSNINVLYIADISNGGQCEQYPEALMRLQTKQGYVLLLSIDGNKYNKAWLSAVFYQKNIDGFWTEITFVKDRLDAFTVNAVYGVMHKGIPIYQLCKEAFNDFKKKQNEIIEKRRSEKQAREELRIKRLQEAENRRIQLQQEVENREREIEQLKAQELKEKEDFYNSLATKLNQQLEPVYDLDGDRLYKCEFCGKIGSGSVFPTCGGVGHINLGTCYDCRANNPAAKMKAPVFEKKKHDPNICPACNGELKLRRGYRGPFMGCSNYPKCRYTRSI